MTTMNADHEIAAVVKAAVAAEMNAFSMSPVVFR
jgi:hypothetical protein